MEPLNIGGGNFAGRSTYAAGLGPVALVLADVNGDGALDAITANASSNNVSVLRGTGTGVLLVPQTYASGRRPSTLATSTTTDTMTWPWQTCMTEL